MARKEITTPLDLKNLDNHNANFEELYKEIADPIESIALRLWEELKENNQIAIKDSVENVSDLPTTDDKHTLRVVLSEQKVYQYNGKEWKVFSEVEIDPYKSIKKELEDLIIEVQNVARANFTLDANSSIPPKITSSGSNFKLVDKVSADEMYVYQVAGNNYLRYFFKKNNGGSGYGVNYELLRVQKVEPISNVVVYKEVANPTTGTVTNLWNFTGTNSAERRFMPYKNFDEDKRYYNEGGKPLQAYQIDGNTSVSYQIQPSSTNKMNIALYARGGATINENFNIEIDGEILKELNIKNSPGQAGHIYEFFIPPMASEFTLTIENKSANAIYLSGINVYALDEYKGQEIDSYVAYGQINKTPFIDSAGASDYALKNIEDGKNFGSYHGGETVQSCKLEYLDMTNFYNGTTLQSFDNIPVNSFYTIKNLSIRQETTLIERAKTFSISDFNSNGSLLFNFSYNIIDGQTPIPLRDLWVGLTCTHSSFNKVKIPKVIDFGDSFSGNAVFFPSSIGLLVQTTKDETQELHIRHSRFKNSFVSTEHPQSVKDIEVYRKYYYAPIRSNTNALVAPVTFQFTKALDFYTI